MQHSWHHFQPEKKLQIRAAGADQGSRPALQVLSSPAFRHTTGVLVFAGMNGNSLPSEVLFNHVPFFSGEVEFGRKLSDCKPNALQTTDESPGILA
ncbi:MAG TPA: hypothetical protein VF773_05375 [Verrucomicrobiae bacterium]